MNRVWLGAVLGVTVGVADVLLMVPMQFQDRTAALLGAFCARFALGFFAATARLPFAAHLGWHRGWTSRAHRPETC